MKCPRCGVFNLPDAVRCDCGCGLDETTAKMHDEEAREENRLAVVGFAGLVVVVGGLVALFWYFEGIVIFVILGGVFAAYLLWGSFLTFRYCARAHVFVYRWIQRRGQPTLPSSPARRKLDRAERVKAIATVGGCLLSVGLMCALALLGGPPTQFNVWSPPPGQFGRGFITTILLVWVPVVSALPLMALSETDDAHWNGAMVATWIAECGFLLTCIVRYLLILEH